MRLRFLLDATTVSRERGGLLTLLILVVGFGAWSPAEAQRHGKLVKQGRGRDSTSVVGAVPVDSLAVPPAPWPVVSGEIALGTACAAGLAYAIGLAAEHTFCHECRASAPGGDTPGILLGIPLGAVAGVWLVGRETPPEGKFVDTALGALAGTAVFAGFSQLLENQGDGVRWSGVILAASVTAIGWNRSRLAPPGPARFRWGGIPAGSRWGGWEVPVLRRVF